MERSEIAIGVFSIAACGNDILRECVPLAKELFKVQLKEVILGKRLFEICEGEHKEGKRNQSYTKRIIRL